MRRALVAACALIALAVPTAPASAHLSSRAQNHPHFSASLQDARHLAKITHNQFGNPDNAHDAQFVAACENGMERIGYNGQYRHSFMMGYTERQTYGYGRTYAKQVRGARAYWLASGRSWGPWADVCEPY